MRETRKGEGSGKTGRRSMFSYKYFSVTWYKLIYINNCYSVVVFLPRNNYQSDKTYFIEYTFNYHLFITLRNNMATNYFDKRFHRNYTQSIFEADSLNSLLIDAQYSSVYVIIELFLFICLLFFNICSGNPKCSYILVVKNYALPSNL